MTATVVTIPIQVDTNQNAAADARVQIIVHIHSEVLDVDVARRRANERLLSHAGNLLGATEPELVLKDRLFWRYDVILGVPNSVQPGSGAMYRVGQIMLDAVSGEIADADALAEELRASASAVVR
jgi:hypothetical protein